ncbi:13177_t:CDS:1, partial [Racocetra fulgida]
IFVDLEVVTAVTAVDLTLVDSKLISTDIGNLASVVSAADIVEIVEGEGGLVVVFDS